MLLLVTGALRRASPLHFEVEKCPDIFNMSIRVSGLFGVEWIFLCGSRNTFTDAQEL
jgi:hypothetical protein